MFGHSRPSPLLKSSFIFLDNARNSKRAFSLIEVVFAISVFAISIISVVGLLAAGLTATKDSFNNFAITNISRAFRANLNATAYTSISGAGSPLTYFTEAGYPTVKNPTSPLDNPFYTASYTAAAPSGSLVSGNAQIVSVSVFYPYPLNVHTYTFSMLVAK